MSDLTPNPSVPARPDSTPTDPSTPVAPAEVGRRPNPWLLSGTMVAVAAILSWVLASATGHAYWYALVAIVAVLSGAVVRSQGGGRQRNRQRDR